MASEVIEKLLIRWKYDLSTVFSSENRDTLTSGIARNSSAPPPPPSKTPSRSYGPPTRSYGPPTQEETRARGYSAPFISAQTLGQSQFRPIQGQRGRPIGFDSGVTSSVGSAYQSGPGVVYSVPSTRQKPPPEQPYSGYRAPSNTNSNTWGYSFSVPSSRQKRQASTVGQLCPTAGQFVMPRAGLNNRGEWRYLINMGELDQQYTQLIRSERCLSSQCSGLCTVPAGMTATCQQQYVQKKMVGLNPNGGEMYTDLYWIPHCCVCQIS
ncbi:Protein spaetzle 5 [Amphibalanus amphitrite]|uniref:Protein spaetzle 5 n=1 Tax=Amphibalanus amphitrite TaxID=1232801 RepID=A0A6A4W621_AMPAM|nr:Protein spaetzle 5 [Amphibalanus amphitrite]